MEAVTVFTKNNRETRGVARVLARECAGMARRKRALVLGLIGDLGGGKTTFTAGFAKALGVKERVTSPTFVLMKIFKLGARKKFRHLIHIDAYRLESARELAALGWKEMITDPRNIIVVEWADKVKKILPKDALILKFKYLSADMRRITIIQNAVRKN